MELTILMPCLNEARTLESCIKSGQSFLASNGIEGEILIADNGSTDGSQSLAKKLGARVVQVTRKGYGEALISGINAAKGRYVVMGDSDASYDFSKLESFMTSLREGNQLVMGNRFAGGIMKGAMPPLHRYFGNPLLSWLGRRFFRSPIEDFHCGLRGFCRDAIVALNLTSQGMEFASEMIVKATLKGYQIAEVPTTLRRDGRNRPPHIRSWRDGWRHLRFLLVFCPRWLFLYPGIALFLIGSTTTAAITQKKIEFLSVGLGIHTLLYAAAATILGVQLIQLALLTKLLGIRSGIIFEPRWIKLTKNALSLELGLLIGMALIVVGLAQSAQLFSSWRSSGFSELNPADVMKSAIPAATAMILGVQACAAALFAAAINFWWVTPRVSR